MVQEVVEKGGKVVGNTFDIAVNKTSGKIDIIHECPTEFEFEADNKVLLLRSSRSIPPLVSLSSCSAGAAA